MDGLRSEVGRSFVERRALIVGGGVVGLTSLLLPSAVSAASGESGYEGSQGTSNPDVQGSGLSIEPVSSSILSMLEIVYNYGASELVITVRYFKQAGPSNTYDGGSLTFLGEKSGTVAGGGYFAQVLQASHTIEPGIYISRVFIGEGSTTWSSQSTFYNSMSL